MLKYNRNYFTDFEFWRKQNIKSKKHFKTIMAVMYGRKKDRGGIKKKYLAAYERARGNAETYKKSNRSRLSATI